jgi:hypothetical protein
MRLEEKEPYFPSGIILEKVSFRIGLEDKNEVAHSDW